MSSRQSSDHEDVPSSYNEDELALLKEDLQIMKQNGADGNPYWSPPIGWYSRRRELRCPFE